MTQTRIGFAILVAGLLGGSTAARAQPEEPPVDEDPENELDPADDDDAGMPAPDEEPVGVIQEPEVVEAVVEEAEHASFGYDKGFYIAHDHDEGTFRLKIGGRVQTLLVADSRHRDDSSRLDRWALSIPRARLTLSGHAFTRRLAYQFQTDFSKGTAGLKDFYVDAGLADRVWLRAGQWKRPFSRQQIGSSGRMDLIERAITDKAFDNGRDIGLTLHNGYEKSPDLEWLVGVWNGTGADPSFGGAVVDPTDMSVDGGGFSNVPEDLLPLVLARVGVNRGGLEGYREVDLEGGPLRWGVGAAVWLEGDFDGGDPPEHQATLDAIVKVEGFSATAAGFLQTVESDLATLGTHLQLGKVFGKDRRRMHAAARYAMVNPRGGGLDDATHEVVIGGGWLPWGHGAKIQLDLSSRIAPGAGFTDHLIARVQGQLSF